MQIYKHEKSITFTRKVIMLSYHLKMVATLTLSTLIMGGCASSQLKQENVDLKQEVAQLEQTRQEYADQLRDIEKMSINEKAQMRDEMTSMRREMENTILEKYFCKISYIYTKKQNIILIFVCNCQKNQNCQKKKSY